MKFILILLLLDLNAFSQTIKILTAGTKTSIRGLSVVNDRIIWVSGNNGMTGRSLDGGNTWKWLQVEGFEKIDLEILKLLMLQLL